jgi:hypothetical protein
MLCATKMLFSSHGNAFVKTSYYYNSTRPKSLSLSPRSEDAEANKQVLQHTINFCARATSPGTSLRVLSKQALVSARQLDSNDNSPMFYGVASQIEISLRFDHEPCSELSWCVLGGCFWSDNDLKIDRSVAFTQRSKCHMQHRIGWTSSYLS